jgi:hypothetical protein
MITHLMRSKKDSALAVKFQPHNHPPDRITNMEGAMHTFVTPLVLALLHGDYVYSSHGHSMSEFECVNGMQRARKVIVSAQVQMDFEGPEVMQALSALQDHSIAGEVLPESFAILSIAENQLPSKRAAYDALLQRHMTADLTTARRLPSLKEAMARPDKTRSVEDAIAFLEDLIRASSSPSFDTLNGTYIRLPKGPVLWLEMLFNTALHQLRNEFSALEVLCPQGYVYTCDPPAIFVRQTGATVLNRLLFAALRKLAAENDFLSMRVFAFNDYADRPAVGLLKHALSRQAHVKVVSKGVLFQGERGAYRALAGTQGVLLVVHNNSDAFGQNVETEKGLGSMDSVIGTYSNVAVCVERTRSDLVSFIM